MADWKVKKNFSLLFNPKDAPSFFSGRWNTKTSFSLADVSKNLNSFELDRRTLKTFSRSQHRPLLITVSKNLAPSPK